MESTIKWKQVYSLLALEFAVIISWIAYHEYQSAVLTQFGLSNFTLEFLVLQAIILFVTPPIAGKVADNMRKKNGKYLPIVNFGVSVVSMIFMSVALTVFIEPNDFTKILLPVLIVFWLISMNIFRSPAFSMVEVFVPQQYLPRVIAIFVLVSDLAFSLEPSVVTIIQAFGGPATFAIGGVLVFTTGYIFFKNSKDLNANPDNADFNIDTADGKSNLFLVSLIAVVIGLFTTYVFKLLPDVLESKIDFLTEEGFSGTYFVSILVAVSAFISLYLGRILQRENLGKNLIIGTVTLTALLALVHVFSSTMVLITICVFLPFFFSLISVTSLPIIFYNLSARQTIFGIGLFYGFSELVDSLLDIVQEMGYLI
jgi:MFS family permease